MLSERRHKMSIFDKLIKVDNDGNLEFNEWVKWNHFLIPDKAGRLREMFRQVMKMFGHCEICTSLVKYSWGILKKN